MVMLQIENVPATCVSNANEGRNMEVPIIGNRTCLYQTPQLNAVLDSMAWQAAGFLNAKQRIMIVGILRRGAPLAEMLHQRLLRRFDLPDITLMNLKVKRYADDLTLLYPETRLTENPDQADLDLTGTTVLVVDDVMYHGHSMLRTVEYLARKQAAEIRTVVLVDRGANKLPVRMDITGVRLDVAPSDIIECNVPPYENEFKIDLLQPGIN
ncbi:pyrimidine operon attenuation protein / uracil phosphoribosyltransferase [Methylophilaceae bacterium]|nr:pyrimidine operon attenuation protein / uracil phosphoribosyltransferase [Methylophilaceae bacterium]